jgi:hypothetical protein
VAIDKGKLYGNYDAGVQRNQGLRDEIVRKALDLPPPGPSMPINTNTRIGVSGWQFVAALVALGSGGLGWYALQAFLPAGAGAGVAEPQEFAVEFFAEDGTPIVVEEQEAP